MTMIKPRIGSRRAPFAQLMIGLSLSISVTAAAQDSPDDAACQPPAPPPGALASTLRLAASDEPGERMVLTLRFRSPVGTPLEGLLVYVYHADATGQYPPAPGATGCARFHGALRGWARPDARGQVLVHSVRPGAYPRSTEPAHVHVVVQFPGRRGYYINDLLFDDDTRLTPAIRRNQRAPGGPGVVHATRDDSGVWQVRREIALPPPTR
jgi:protocatechuate 3,4-dioxygenase, beta subunit